MNAQDGIWRTIRDALDLAVYDALLGGNEVLIELAKTQREQVLAELETRWEQIGNMPDTPCGCGDPECTRTIGMNDEVLYIEDEGEYLTAHLPDGYALCRLVEVTP